MNVLSRQTVSERRVFSLGTALTAEGLRQYSGFLTSTSAWFMLVLVFTAMSPMASIRSCDEAAQARLSYERS